MAKSERATPSVEELTVTGQYDAEALMKRDLSNLPDEPEMSGTWRFQFRGGKAVNGVTAKGPWLILNLFFQPIEPIGDSELTQAEIDELPSVRHRVFATKNRDLKELNALFAKMEVEPGVLEDMVEEAKGEYIVARITLGVDNRGEPEYKLTHIKADIVEEDEAVAA